ncbi:sensor histidine kinase [Microvirga sp. CF3062]|uniref:sensor histidine kinase n=1 Tax=Microvirga sp. CF3062 TaxID=3110182 RepID=UPI002E7A1F68|nr:sensor histidine kinase [Microvirga sp. CF3062]MEE1656239.1 sensor histidine kinase [Microvirga sp. CF3062]
MAVGMVAMGTLVTSRIEKSVTTVKAASVAFSVNNFIAPHIQELASSEQLSLKKFEDLKHAIDHSGLLAQVTSFRIWRRGGFIVYSNEPHVSQQDFLESSGVSQAWSGAVQVQFDDDIPLIKVFAPVRDSATGSALAVVESHEHVSALDSELVASKWQIWLATALITLNMMGCLFVIVAHSGRIIDRQRLALVERVSQLSEILQQNRLLQGRIERAARKTTEDNERLLRRMGYDLHDGVAQLVSLALLRLDKVKGSPQERDNLHKIHKALSDALGDIRNICKGLLLPEVRSMTLKEALMFMIRTHERRTGTTIECTIAELPDQAPEFVKIALCRFIQEALNNAFKHAGGQGQRIDIAWNGAQIMVEVADRGPGIDDIDRCMRGPGLGLASLRDRIESIGGDVTMNSASNAGTRITASLPLVMEISDAA